MVCKCIGTVQQHIYTWLLEPHICYYSITMEASLVPYGNIVEGSRRSLSHISSKDIVAKTSTDKVHSMYKSIMCKRIYIHMCVCLCVDACMCAVYVLIPT